jgi:hypothetical protein
MITVTIQTEPHAIIMMEIICLAFQIVNSASILNLNFQKLCAEKAWPVNKFLDLAKQWLLSNQL